MHSQSLSLPNGGLWPDVAGVHVNAHGGGLLKEGGLWYWYGEHKTADFRDGRLVISWRDTFPPAAENERGGI